MREMIEQLETDKVGVETKDQNKDSNVDQIKAVKKKSHKKIKSKEIEIKTKEKELQSLKDQLQ